MKTLLLSALLLAAPAPAADPAADPAVQAPIKAMMAAFNKGDVAAAKATHVASPMIIDEVAAPYAWGGPTAFDDWIGTLARSEEAHGRSGGVVTIGAATRETVDGGTAYVIAPSTYTFMQKGQKMREVGSMTFVLAKQDTGWKIASWTWTSPEAAPVK